MKLFQSLFALSLAVTTAFAGGQKASVLEAPALRAQIPSLGQALPNLQLTSAVDVQIPLALQPTAMASLQTATLATAPQNFEQLKPVSPEQQTVAAAKTFDGLTVAAGQATAPIEVGETPVLPNHFALLPAAARMLQRHHITRPSVDRLLSRAMRGMLQQAGVKTAKEARPHFKTLRQALTPQVHNYGLTLFVYENEPAFVNEVSRGSPAEKAGIRSGDEITHINGLDARRIDEDLLKEIMKSGHALELTVQRAVESGSVSSFKTTVAPGDYLETEFHKTVAGISAAFATVAKAFAPTAAPALLDAALKAMAGSLDRFTAYLNADDAKEYRNGLKEEHYGGLGLRLEASPGGMRIVGVAPGSPAARAGLLENDVVQSVDGASLAGLTSEQASLRLKREIGESVRLVVKTAAGATRELALITEDVGIPLVGGSLLPNHVGYIYLVSFSQDSVNAAHRLIRALRAQGARKLIVDLRFNPGGELEAATEFAGLFLRSRSLITKLIGTRGESRAVTQHHGEFSSLPLAVILNRHSASASELFTAAVRDHGRAFVVGETSFGKGVGQETHGLTEGRALKITSFRWYSPDDENLTIGNGIKPDIALDWKEEDMDPMFREIAGPLFSGKTPGLEDPAVKAAWTGFQPVDVVRP